MADIATEIQKIQEAIYGEEVRGAIVDALEAMNENTEAAEAWATGGSGGTPSATNNAAYYAEQAAASAATLQIDDTLSVSGRAADAKVTGDVAEVTKEIAIGTYKSPYSVAFDVIEGGIGVTGGNYDYGGTRARTQYIPISSGEFYVVELTSNTFSIERAFAYGNTTQESVTRQLPVLNGKVLAIVAHSGEAYIRFSFVYASDDTHVITEQERTEIRNAIKITRLTDKTLTASGIPADAKATGAVVDWTDSRVKNVASGLAISRYAPPIKQIETGFINNSGVLSSNSNYRTLTYDIPTGSEFVEATKVYVGGSSSDYSVFAAYDENNNFLGGLNNQTVNTSTSGQDKDTGAWKLPIGTAYVKVSYGNRSSVTTYYDFFAIGIFHYDTKSIVFGGHANSSHVYQYYFNVPITEIGADATITINAKFKFPVNITQYDYYVVTYGANYTGRTILTYQSNLTDGITGNELTLSGNRWDASKTMEGAAYVGVLVNFKLAAPITENATSAFENDNTYRCVSEYCLINGIQCHSNYYPAGAVNSYAVKEYVGGYNPMLGGRLCCIGDSLTAVYYKDETESWPYLIAKWNSMSYDNLGQSSCPVAYSESWHISGNQCMAEKVDDLIPSKYYTHIFVMGGANDYNQSIPIGENTDTEITTFKGAVNHIIDKLTEIYPFAKIVFATTYQRTASRADKPYADAMLEVCRLRSIPCLNNYENSGVQMQNANWMAMFGANNTTSNKHLNAAGDLFVAPRFENALKYGV